MKRRYPVRKKSGTLVLGALFFGACALFLFWYALRTDGVIINGILELGRSGARVFLFAICALSLGMTGMALFALVAVRDDREVLLEDESITGPSSTWRNTPPRTIRFADITRLREQQVSGEQFLTIHARGGKLVLTRSLLPDGAYAEIVRELRSRAPRT
jgi:hypothetical protein